VKEDKNLKGTNMLNHAQYLIKEEVSFLKLTDRYNIFDPNTNAQLGYAVETIPTYLKLLRLLINKSLLPSKIEVRDRNENLVFTIKKSPDFFKAKVDIFDASGNAVGYFKSKIFTIGGKFDVFQNNDTKVAEVTGDWKGWNFSFMSTSGNELGTVTKKWAGIGRELFTSADNYMITINESIKSPLMNILLLNETALR